MIGLAFVMLNTFVRVALVCVVLASFSFSATAASVPRINEILANNHAPLLPGARTGVDWVELSNDTDEDIDLSGMSLSDRPENPLRWVIPPGSQLLRHGYMVVTFDSVTPPTTVPARYPNTGYGLKSSGDKVYLFEPAARGGAILDNVAFGLQVEDKSIGLSPLAGAWTLNVPTPGRPNTIAELGNPRLLKINEWMAKPTKGSDWFELFNPTSLPVELSGLFLSDLASKLTLSRLPALSFMGAEVKGYTLLVADKSPANGADHVAFKLNKDGGAIYLTDKDGKTKIDSIVYSAQTLGVSEGRLPDGNGRIGSFSDGPSPASANFLAMREIVFNEILSHADDPYEDAFEFFNLTAQSIDMSGFFVSDNTQDPRRYRIPDGTIIDPRGYAVVYRFQFQPHPGVPPSFGLSSAHGDSLFLFGTDAQGNLNGFRTGGSFPAAVNNVPFTRYNSSIGPQLTPEVYLTMGTPIRGTDSEELLPLLRTGKGAPNGLPLIELLVINEIHYYPPGSIVGTESVLDEYIELRSLVSNPLPLFDPAFPSNVWWIAGSVEYSFPRNKFVAPESSVLIVGFDPERDPSQLAAFRSRYALASGVQIFGPYRGVLANTNGSVQLFRPDVPQFCFDFDYGWVPPILVDHVDYSSTDPWPSAANGAGYSLQRKMLTDYGNDPVNWQAATPTPGQDSALPPVPEKAPWLSLLPFELWIPFGITTNLTVAARGAVTHVEWRFNGELIRGATTTNLSLNAVTPNTTGIYSVLVSNPYGAANATCFVRVQSSPAFLTQPKNQSAAPGGLAFFSVTAVGTPPFQYQWTHDGVPIPKGTNASLLVTPVASKHPGNYSVRLMTSAGNITSTVATLSLMAQQPPILVSQPQGAYFRSDTPLTIGSPFTLSGQVSGSEPLTYSWWQDGKAVIGATSSTLQLDTFARADIGNYSLMASNAFGSVTSTPVFLTELLLPTVTVAASATVVEEGANIVLTAQATGTRRLYYQWQLNEVDINGEQCPEHQIPSIQPSQAGEYRVVVRNAAGTTESETIVIKVRPRLSNLRPTPDGIVASFRSTPEATYSVFASSDLTHWILIDRLAPSDTEATVLLRYPAVGSSYFYKLECDFRE